MSSSPPPPLGELLLSEPALCLSTHATSPLIAAGSATGRISISRARDSHATETARTLPPACDASCRVLSWLGTDSVVLGYSDSSVYAYNVAREKARCVVASLGTGGGGGGGDGGGAGSGDGVEAASAMCVVSEDVLLVGDEGGGLSVCDTRVGGTVVSVLEQGDYVSGIEVVEMYGTRAVLATSGDGTLCAYDMRVVGRPRLKLMYAFDSFQDDLTSMCVLGEGGLVVGGTLGGALQLYNARFMDRECEAETVEHVERFVGHPKSVTAVAAVDDRALVCTASTDGFVRVVDVRSRELVDLLDYAHDKGEEGEDALWPIENMAAVNGLGGRRVFALQSHDKAIKLCEYIPEGEGGEEQGPEGHGEAQEQGETREQGGKRREAERPQVASKKRKFAAKKERERLEAAARSKAFFDGL